MPASTSLSVVLIVLNEEKVLQQCLESIKWADEIIVVDSGSTDATINIAKQYTEKIFHEQDWQGYGIQRQRAQQYATSDWILMIDADERLTPDLKEEIERVLNENDQTKVFALPRLSYCFGGFIHHSGWYPDYVVRLYPREKASYGTEVVHEKLHYPASMRMVKLNGNLLHYTYRDLEHYLVKSANYAAAWATQRQEQGKRVSLLTGVLHGLWCFLRMYIFRVGFLDGKQGFLLAVLSAHSTFVKYADLWVRNRIVEID